MVHASGRKKKRTVLVQDKHVLSVLWVMQRCVKELRCCHSTVT